MSESSEDPCELPANVGSSAWWELVGTDHLTHELTEPELMSQGMAYEQARAEALAKYGGLAVRGVGT